MKMELTPENKKHIDSLSHCQLLAQWRNAPTGSPWFQGKTGDYWGKRMAELRDQDKAQAVADSKAIGFGATE